MAVRWGGMAGGRGDPGLRGAQEEEKSIGNALVTAVPLVPVQRLACR